MGLVLSVGPPPIFGGTRSGVKLHPAHCNDLPLAKKHTWCAGYRSMVRHNSKPLHIPVSLCHTPSLKRESASGAGDTPATAPAERHVPTKPKRSRNITFGTPHDYTLVNNALGGVRRKRRNSSSANMCTRRSLKLLWHNMPGEFTPPTPWWNWCRYPGTA